MVLITINRFLYFFKKNIFKNTTKGNFQIKVIFIVATGFAILKNKESNEFILC